MRKSSENMRGFKALRENATYKLSPEGTAENVPGLQSWADCEFSSRVVSP
jgi:hypothetical protein